MNSIPRISRALSSKNANWICTSCAKSKRTNTPFFKPSISRSISNDSTPRGNVAPTMEQLRAPFSQKNSSTMYYTLSIILGTVAFSYGSVPMYKMVYLIARHFTTPKLIYTSPDLPDYRMGRATDQSTRTWRQWCRGRRSIRKTQTRHFCKTYTSNL